MIKLQVIGNVGRDATISEVKGKKAINFNLAHNEYYTDQNGVKVEKTMWVNCSMWRDGNQSTAVASYIKKGAKVYVEGTPEVSIYEDKNGGKNAQLRLMVRNLEVVEFVGDTSTGSVSGVSGASGVSEIPVVPEGAVEYESQSKLGF
jgi:single-strand DNA-binding protein